MINIRNMGRAVRSGAVCAVAGAALLAGCTSTTTQTGSSAQAAPVATQKSTPAAEPQAEARTASTRQKRKDPNELVCQRYKPTGSHRSVTRCVTRAQKTAERDSAILGLQQAAGASLSDNAVNNAGGGPPP
ncbi:MAG: hypothetical protein AAFU65_06150 [Pseudomonadota bacterium]